MGQKVSPIGFRLGINRTWDSRWFSDSNYSNLLHEDLKIRGFLRKRLAQAGVSAILIERPAKKAGVTRRFVASSATAFAPFSQNSAGLRCSGSGQAP